MSKLLKEPLLHLLVLGAALFGEKFAAAPRAPAPSPSSWLAPQRWW